MPHDHHELALLDLRIAKDSVALLVMWQIHGPARAYFLLRKIRPSVESVLIAIQKHVISFSLRGRGAASTTGFSMYGSSSSSCDSRGSMLSTRPSVEGRFSTVDAIRFLLAFNPEGPASAYP
jgi:hypothetical protein